MARRIRPLGAVHQLRDGVADRRGAVARDQLSDALGGLPAGPEHRLEVATSLARPAHVAEDQVERGLVRPAAIDDPDRRDADAFLEDLGRAAREAARAHPAHVTPVRAHDGNTNMLAVREERIDHRHVVEVSPAGVGLVVQEDVARVDVVAELLPHRLHRPGDRHDVERMILPPGHGDDLRVAVHEHAGEVLALVEDRRVRGAHQGHAHLAHDRDERLAQHLEGDGIDHARGLPLETEVAVLVDRAAPARRNDGRRAELLDDGGPAEVRPAREAARAPTPRSRAALLRTTPDGARPARRRASSPRSGGARSTAWGRGRRPSVAR